MLRRAGCGSHADHQRLAARQAGRRAQEGRPRSRHRQPRFARRRHLPRDERRRFPGGEGDRGHRGRRRRRPRPGQDQHGGEARRQRPRASCRWPSAGAAPATSCASSSTWTSAAPTAGAWTTWCPPPKWCAASRARWPLEPIDANYAGEVAERWRYVDGAGEIGVISSVTQAFCSSCTRMRLSTEGSLYTCLFAQSRPRPEVAAARRRVRRRAAQRDRRGVAAPRGPLFGNPHRRNRQERKKSRCPTSVAKPKPHQRSAARRPSKSRPTTSAARWCRPRSPASIRSPSTSTSARSSR